MAMLEWKYSEKIAMNRNQCSGICWWRKKLKMICLYNKHLFALIVNFPIFFRDLHKYIASAIIQKITSTSSSSCIRRDSLNGFFLLSSAVLYALYVHFIIYIFISLRISWRNLLFNPSWIHTYIFLTDYFSSSTFFLHLHPSQALNTFLSVLVHENILFFFIPTRHTNIYIFLQK
jgi:hypothetical protein